MATPEPERERAGLLVKQVTFTERPGSRGAHHPPAAGAAGVPAGAESQDLITKVFGTKNANNQRVSESLDYEPVQNKIFYDRIKAAKEKRHLAAFGYTGHTLAKFVITLLTGIITGMFAVGLSRAVHHAFEAKNEFIQSVLDEPGPAAARLWTAFGWHALYSCSLVTLAVALVQYWAPQAAGAGVTLVMAYLNGNHVPNLLRLRTLVTKFVGTICSVSAGLPMGPEGPMVHIGACVASVITYAQCNCMRTGTWMGCFGRRLQSEEAKLREKLKVLDDIVSDTDHREFISAGSSAGISAAFGAPVGGVLFAMEEACSFWNRKTAWRCFIAAVCATFTLAQMNHNATHGMLGLTNIRNMENADWVMQLPFILINAGVAGLLGAIFNSLRMWLWKLRASKTRHVLRIGEVIGLALLCCGSGFFWAWAAGRCIPKNPEWGDAFGIKFTCEEEGTHNDLATLFLSSSHDTIVHLFSMGHSPGQAYITHFTKGSLALFVVIYLILMSIGAGVAIPGGLFMPSIIVGAAWGGLWGSQLREWLPDWNVQPGLYGLMAATGVLGGVFRSSISLVVLVIEGTHGVEFMWGVILSVVIANWVAQHIHHDGVYESELERIGNLYFLRDEPPNRLHTLTAETVMATGVYGFRPVESVARILEVLRGTTHNGFPVYACPGGGVGPAAPAGCGGEGGCGGAAAARGAPSPLAPSPLAPSPLAPASLGADGVGVGGVTGGLAHSIAGAAVAAAARALAPSLSLQRPASAGGALADEQRVEGLILRSQLLVLLQRRHFCAASGAPLGRELNARAEIEIETEMRTFFRRYFTHNRYVSATATPLDALQLDGVPGVEALYLDLRPYMNRSPFTVRKDCSASRAHQAFVGLNLRHLMVVDAHNRLVGIVTRKDLDHAAGHGWWRMSAPAPKPHNNRLNAQLNRFVADAGSFFRKIPSVGFLSKLAGGGGKAGGGAAAGNAAVAATLEKQIAAKQAASGGGGGAASGLSSPRAAGTPLGVGRDVGGAQQHQHQQQHHRYGAGVDSSYDGSDSEALLPQQQQPDSSGGGGGGASRRRSGHGPPSGQGSVI